MRFELDKYLILSYIIKLNILVVKPLSILHALKRMRAIHHAVASEAFHLWTWRKIPMLRMRRIKVFIMHFFIQHENTENLIQQIHHFCEKNSNKIIMQSWNYDIFSETASNAPSASPGAESGNDDDDANENSESKSKDAESNNVNGKTSPLDIINKLTIPVTSSSTVPPTLNINPFKWVLRI